MTPTTDTPRTDALADYANRQDGEWEVVPADFARELERELAEAKQWLDERYKALSEADDRAEKAEAKVERRGVVLGNINRLAVKYGTPNGKSLDIAMEQLITEAKAEVERLKGIVKAQQDELEAISFAIGTNEGHSSVDHIVTLKDNLRRAVEIAVNLSWDYADTEYDEELDQLKATLKQDKK